MISYRDLVQQFRQLGLTPNRPLIVHCAFSSFGEDVRGGPEAVVGALLTVCGRIMTPTFTYKTMITPEIGPENNGITYGTGKDTNRMAEFYYPEMPADLTMGILAEEIRRHPSAHRSNHPILSFSGVGLNSILDAQTIDDPLGAVHALADQGGDVLLIGVDQTVNTSIHYAEKVAGRKQFTRWALAAKGVRECQGWPGCSNGFNRAEEYLSRITRRGQIGRAAVQVIPIMGMVNILAGLIAEQPLALLCSRPDCERCNAVRAAAQPAQ